MTTTIRGQMIQCKERKLRLHNIIDRSGVVIPDNMEVVCPFTDNWVGGLAASPERHAELARNKLQLICERKYTDIWWSIDSEDVPIYISEKMGVVPCTINPERTHCYFTTTRHGTTEYFKSRIWIDAEGRVFGCMVTEPKGKKVLRTHKFTD